MDRESWKVPVFALGLLMGTASTLVVKALYQTTGVDSHGEMKLFEKPLFMTFIMFLGMSFAIPLNYIIIYFQKKNAKSTQSLDSRENTPLKVVLSKNIDSDSYDAADPFGDVENNNSSSYQHASIDAIEESSVDASALDDPRALLDVRLNLLLLIPSFFDLFGSALSTIGLMYTSVSVYQLSRCSVIIVTALLKAFVLGHHLAKHAWVGVLINTVAMGLVGATAFFDDSNPDIEGASDARLGMLFILASCLVQGAQYVFEEKVLSLDAVPPLILVGMEGIWGVILCLGVVFPLATVLPGLDGGMYEDIGDAVFMATHNRDVFLLMAAFALIVFFYNVFCIYITFLLNSIWHAIMDNCRPVAVWTCGLIFYYSIGRIGEPWTGASWFELAGMLLLFYGTAVYNGNATFPGVPVDEDLDSSDLVGLRDPLPATPHIGSRTPRAASATPLSAAAMLTQSPALMPRPARAEYSAIPDGAM